MTRQYVALIRKEKDTDYWVDIPDFPGCISCGESVEEAKVNFREAIDFHLEGMNAEEKSKVPLPRSRAEVLESEEDPFIDDFMIDIDLVTH